MTGLDRDTAKAVNFAKIYGAGVKKFAEMIGKPLRRSAGHRRPVRRANCRSCRSLSAVAQEMAERIGYTELYDGARRHWNLYEAAGISTPRARARARSKRRGAAWQTPRIPGTASGCAAPTPTRRSNALIQGAAARHTKLWMRACWREGIVPLLQMHDCLDCSVTYARTGRAGGAARLRGRHARGADAGRSEIRQELGRRQARMGRCCTGRSRRETAAKPVAKLQARPQAAIRCVRRKSASRSRQRSPLPPAAKPAIVRSRAAANRARGRIGNLLPERRMPPRPDNPPASPLPARRHDARHGDRSGRPDRRAGAAEPQDLLPLPRREDAEPAHLSRSLLLLRLRRARRSRRLADAGRGTGLRRGAARARQLGRPGRSSGGGMRRRRSKTEKERRAPCNCGTRQADPGTLAARYLADVRGIDLDALPANIDDRAALPSALPVRPRHHASLPARADARRRRRCADRHPAHRADRRRPEDRPHDVRPRRRGEAVAGRQAARRRRRAGDDARRRHAAAVSRRAAAAGLGDALGRRA